MIIPTPPVARPMRPSSRLPPSCRTFRRIGAYAPPPIPAVFFQGDLSQIVGTNQVNTNHPPLSGTYDFTFQMVDAPSNGLPVGLAATQSVAVVNGLFNVPLPFDFVSFCDGSTRWITGGVRPSQVPAVQFSPLSPALPITPAPQAIYAYAAGVVTDITPGPGRHQHQWPHGQSYFAGGTGDQP